MIASGSYLHSLLVWPFPCFAGPTTTSASVSPKPATHPALQEPTTTKERPDGADQTSKVSRAALPSSSKSCFIVALQCNCFPGPEFFAVIQAPLLLCLKHPRSRWLNLQLLLRKGQLLRTSQSGVVDSQAGINRWRSFLSVSHALL